MSPRSFLSALVFAAALVQLFAQVDGPRRSKGYVTTDVVPTVSLQAGKTAQVELHFRVNPGYHVNSHTPGSELLIPTTLDFKPLEKIKAGKIAYPHGEELALPF